jgi:hypothetical protein
LTLFELTPLGLLMLGKSATVDSAKARQLAFFFLVTLQGASLGILILSQRASAVPKAIMILNVLGHVAALLGAQRLRLSLHAEREHTQKDQRRDDDNNKSLHELSPR